MVVEYIRFFSDIKEMTHCEVTRPRGWRSRGSNLSNDVSVGRSD